jgi:tRNA(Ile)-lysidine synthase
MRNVERWAAQEAMAEGWISIARDAWVEQHGDRHIIKLTKLRSHRFRNLLMGAFLKPFNFGYQQARAIAGALDRQPGTQFLSISHRVFLDRDFLIIDPLQEFDETEEVALVPELPAHIAYQDGEFSTEWLLALPTAPLSTDLALLDGSRLQFPLTLRPWRPGDWFVPSGMKQGRKKIGDFLDDKRVPLPDKRQVWVLCSGDDIVWVVGWRVDERFRAQETSRRLWLARWNKRSLGS